MTDAGVLARVFIVIAALVLLAIALHPALPYVSRADTVRDAVLLRAPR